MVKFAPKSEIERVRDASSIYDIVSLYVELKNAGVGTRKGLCPFHDEKTPSFTVRDTTSTYHCFGCGETGDIFAFIMKMNGVEFYEALDFVAAKSGVSINWEERTGRGGGINNNNDGEVTRKRIIEINNYAAKVFAKNIELPEAAIARKMLTDRSFTQLDCEKFECGYATKSQDDLTRELMNQGFQTAELVAAGIVTSGGGKTRDRFQGRVIWPIRDVAGDCLGFGARKLYDDDFFDAKYLNTAETRVYKKSKVLYGIDKARKPIAANRQVVIVEGYTDVMAMHLAGIDTAVATCGTAFGREHALFLRRLMGDTDRKDLITSAMPKQNGKVIFTFDGDEAGIKAAWKSSEFMGEFMSQAYVAIAPDKMDPCDLRLKRGDQALQSLVNNAQPMLAFMIDTIIKSYDLSSAGGKSEMINAAAKVLARVEDMIMKDIYKREISAKTGISVDIIDKSINSALGYLKQDQSNSYQQYNTKPVDFPLVRIHNKSASRKTASSITEKQYIALLLQFTKHLRDADFFNVTPKMITNDFLRQVYQKIDEIGGIEYAKIVGEKVWISKLFAEFTEKEQKWVSVLTTEPLEVHTDEAAANFFHELSVSLQRSALRKDVVALSTELAATPVSSEKARELHASISEIEKKIRTLR